MRYGGCASPGNQRPDCFLGGAAAPSGRAGLARNRRFESTHRAGPVEVGAWTAIEEGQRLEGTNVFGQVAARSEDAKGQRAVVKVIAFTWAFAAYLLMLAVAAIVVGAHDASIAQAGIAVTASSAVLLVVGVVLLLAAYQLIGIGRRSRWRDGVRPPCRPIVLVAFLLAILVCIYVFFSAIRTASTQRTVVVAVALALALAAVAGLGFFGRDARV